MISTHRIMLVSFASMGLALAAIGAGSAVAGGNAPSTVLEKAHLLKLSSGQIRGYFVVHTVRGMDQAKGGAPYAAVGSVVSLCYDAARKTVKNLGVAAGGVTPLGSGTWSVKDKKGTLLVTITQDASSKALSWALPGADKGTLVAASPLPTAAELVACK